MILKALLGAILLDSVHLNNVPEFSWQIKGPQFLNSRVIECLTAWTAACRLAVAPSAVDCVPVVRTGHLLCQQLGCTWASGWD